jgi:hypothetical protein
MLGSDEMKILETISSEETSSLSNQTLEEMKSTLTDLLNVITDIKVSFLELRDFLAIVLIIIVMVLIALFIVKSCTRG